MVNKTAYIVLIAMLIAMPVVAETETEIRIEYKSDMVIWYETYNADYVVFRNCYNLTLRECLIIAPKDIHIMSGNITLWNTTAHGHLRVYPHSHLTVVNPDIGTVISVDHDNATLTVLYTVDMTITPPDATIMYGEPGLYERGEYDYLITCPGYYDMYGSFNVTDTPLQLSVELIEKPAPNVPPIAIAGDDREVSLGYEMLISGSQSYDTDGTIERWQWVFVDNGTTIDERWFWHTWNVPNNHTLKLWVYDDRNAVGTDTMTVLVIEPEPINETEEETPIIEEPPIIIEEPPLNETNPINETELPIIIEEEPVVEEEPPLHESPSNTTYYPPPNVEPKVESVVEEESSSPTYWLWIIIGAMIIIFTVVCLCIRWRYKEKEVVYEPEIVTESIYRR